MDLSLQTRSQDGMTIVGVGGEIDIVTEAQLRDHLLQCILLNSPRLVVDLTDVTFLDCAALAVFVTVHHRAEAAGGWLRLANPPRLADRLFAITGLDGLFHLAADVEHAITPEQVPPMSRPGVA